MQHLTQTFAGKIFVFDSVDLLSFKVRSINITTGNIVTIGSKALISTHILI